MIALCASSAALSISRGASAQQTPAISSVRLSPPVATVGDRLDLTIEVAHDGAYTVEGPGFGDNFGGLELIAVAEPRVDRGGAATRTTLTYTLAAFATGELELPALPVRWRGAGGAGTLMTPPQRITIQSVLQPGETDLRPLKPQLDIPEAAPSPLVPAAYVAIFAVLTAFGYVLVARALGTQPSTPGAIAPTPLTPAQAARESLDALAASGAARSDIAAYYATIAATVRRYLSERYGFAAYAMTRTELSRRMSVEELGRWPARLTANLLEGCDAVQFAAFVPALERAEADLTAAYEIIEITQPPEEAETAPMPSAPSPG